LQLELRWKRRHEQYQKRRDGETTQSPRQEAEHAVRPTERRTGAKCTKRRNKHASCETDDSKAEDPDDEIPGAGREFNRYPTLAQWFRDGPGQARRDNDRQSKGHKINQPQEEPSTHTTNSEESDNDEDDNINHIHLCACLHVPDPIGRYRSSFEL
jgi:hypothetical protein